MLGTLITPARVCVFHRAGNKKAPGLRGQSDHAEPTDRSPPEIREPAVGIEPTTARLRIECSTTELRWHICPGADSNRYAFRHHPLKMACLPISPPGL